MKRLNRKRTLLHSEWRWRALGIILVLTVAAGWYVGSSSSAVSDICCEDGSSRSGIDDSGAPPTEPAYPSVDLLLEANPPGGSFAWFDNPTPGWFGHTVVVPASSDCLEKAQLVFRAIPQGTASESDSIRIGFAPGAFPQWTGYFGSGNASPGLLPDLWNATNYPNGYTFALNLGDLNPDGVRLIEDMKSIQSVDFVAAGSTTIDFMDILVTFCPCPPECSCPFQCNFNADPYIDITDLNKEIEVIFFNGPNTQDPGCPTPRGDFNNSGATDAVDLNLLIGYLFFNKPGPTDPCI